MEPFSKYLVRLFSKNTVKEDTVKRYELRHVCSTPQFCICLRPDSRGSLAQVT